MCPFPCPPLAALRTLRAPTHLSCATFRSWWKLGSAWASAARQARVRSGVTTERCCIARSHRPHSCRDRQVHPRTPVAPILRPAGEEARGRRLVAVATPRHRTAPRCCPSQEGSVLVDGIDVRQWNVRHLRDMIGVVQQVRQLEVMRRLWLPYLKGISYSWAPSLRHCRTRSSSASASGKTLRAESPASSQRQRRRSLRRRALQTRTRLCASCRMATARWRARASSPASSRGGSASASASRAPSSATRESSSSTRLHLHLIRTRSVLCRLRSTP